MKLFKVVFKMAPITVVTKFVTAKDFGHAENEALDRVQKKYNNVSRSDMTGIHIVSEEDPTGTIPGTDWTLMEALRRGVAGAKPQEYKEREKWIAVKHTFNCGSTYAKKLCEYFGWNPDEKVSRRLPFRPYNEIINAVQTKHEGETRHETALRYIQEQESELSQLNKIYGEEE